MVSQKVTVMNASGLHARPANAFVKEAVRHAGCNILIKKDGKTYNVTSSNVWDGQDLHWQVHRFRALRLREVRYGDRAGRRWQR